jgi:uncharacterized protein YdeI (YjbR/CyaY-like superfamily)
MEDYNIESYKLINVYINELPDWSKKICLKLRQIILSTYEGIREDWKWNRPAYYCNGLICGIWVFKDHVTLVFFNGSTIDDCFSVLESSYGGLYGKHIKYMDVSEINESIIKDYLLQSINNNIKGVRINKTKNKIVDIPYSLKNALEKEGLLEKFNDMCFSDKKKIISWIREAKREETKNRRVENVINRLKDRFGFCLKNFHGNKTIKKRFNSF